MTLVYPERQMDMINTMLDMYREHGWLPKWELYGRETLTMEGDPSLPVKVYAISISTLLTKPCISRLHFRVKRI